MNSNNILCASFGLFPSYVAGILNSVKEISFYALCNKKDYDVLSTLKNILLGECTCKLRTDNYFVLTSGNEEVISFQSRFFGGKLPSELIFAQSLLKIAIVSGLRCCVHQ
jgi:hypothetical protein